MFRIRDEQIPALAGKLAGESLVAEFSRLGYRSTIDKSKNEILVADKKGNTTSLKLGQFGRVSRVTMPSGSVSDVSYDSNFRLSTLSESTGLKTAFNYDDNGLLRALSRGVGHDWAFEWDEWRNLTKATYPDKTNIEVTYAGPDMPLAFTDRSGNRSRFERSESGTLVAAVDPLGNRTAFEYAEWDRPGRIVRPDGTQEDLHRNAAGRLVSGSVNGELWAQLSYDAQGRVQEVHYADGHFVAFEYDDAGNIVEARNPSCVVKREYDKNKRLVSEEQPGGAVKFAYDPAGLLTSLTTPKGETLRFSYDEDSRLAKVEDWNGGAHEFQYATALRHVEHLLPNHAITETALTERGFATEINTKLPGLSAPLSLRYERNPNDQVALAHDNEIGVKKFSYNPNGFVLGVGSASLPIEQFSYDENGNRITVNSASARFNSLNQMTGQGSSTMTYDSRGNLIKLSSPEGETRYKYNGQNLLVEANLPDGRHVQFAYDAFGRRVSKKIGSVETAYVWAGNQLLGESTRGPKPEQRDYLFIPNSYTPLSFRVNGKVFQYHTDHKGTPRWVTDEAGRVVWSANISAFGETSLLREDVKQCIRFAGHYFDEETGLHYNRARYYSPHLGRYLSRDPLEIVGGLNFYIYAGNDPVNQADPLGLIGFWQGVLAVTAVAVGVAILVVAAPVIAAAVVAVAAGGAIAAGTIGAAAAVVGGAALLGAGIGLALAPEDASPGDQAMDALQGAMYGAGAALAVMGAAFGAAGLVAGCGGGGLAAAGAGGGSMVLSGATSTVAANAVGAGAAAAAAGVMMMSGNDKMDGGGRGRKGESFRGGKKSQRDNWYGKDDKDFQRWWHREGKEQFGGKDIENAQEAQEAYDEWVSQGKPTVR